MQLSYFPRLSTGKPPYLDHKSGLYRRATLSTTQPRLSLKFIPTRPGVKIAFPVDISLQRYSAAAVGRGFMINKKPASNKAATLEPFPRVDSTFLRRGQRTTGEFSSGNLLSVA